MRYLTVAVACALLVAFTPPQASAPPSPDVVTWVAPGGTMAVSMAPDYVTDETQGLAGVGKPDLSLEWKSGGLKMAAHFYKKSNESYADFVARVSEAKELLLEAFPKDPGT